MATGQEIINNVRDQLLEPVAGFWTDAELLRRLNQAEKDFVNEVRGLIERDAYLSLVQGQTKYPLPQDWASAQAVFYKAVDGDKTRWRRLHPTNLEKQAQEYPDFATRASDNQDEPRSYWIWGSNIYVYPAPDTTGDGDLRLFYHAKSPGLLSLSSTINIDDTFAPALEAYVLWKAWSKEKEAGLADREQARYIQYIREGRRWVKKRSGDQKWKFDIQSHHGFSTYSGISGINPFE